MSNPMTAEEKAWIDRADYETLLGKWRFSPAGDPYFSGETGDYFIAALRQKRPENHAAISKRVGWGR